MSSKKFSLGCVSVLGAAAVLFFGGRYLTRQVLGQQLTPLNAAEVIPDEAIFASFVATDSQKWSRVRELGNPKAQQLLDTQIEDLEARIATEVENFNYQEDIQPWLGGAMFAMVPEPNLESEPNLLMVFGIKNKFKALDFLNKIQADSQIELQESQYKGIKITESKSADNTIVSALIGSKLLLSEEIDVIEQAIDTYKGEPSLASISSEMLAQKLDTGDALIRFYVPNYNNLISQAIAESNPGVPFDISTLQPIESTAIGLGVEKGGLRLQSVTKFNSELVETSFSANQGKILNRFPEDTVALVSGQGIDEFWSQAIALFKQEPELSKYFNLAKLSVRQATNIDLEKDLFNWMDGEFALGIVPTPESLIPELDRGLSAGIMLESSQPEKARKTLAKLENTLQQYLETAPSQSKIDNKAVTQWQAYNVPGVLNYGWLDRNHLLFTADNFTFKSIGKPNKSLAKSKKFKAIARKLPRHNSGYLYVDMAQIMDLFSQLSATEADPETEQAIAWFDSIQSIGSTVTMPDESTTQQDLFVLFEDN